MAGECLSWRRWLRRAGKLGLVLLALYLMLRWFEHSQVFQPSRTLDTGAGDLQRPFEDVRFAAGDGVELNGWFFPAGTNSPRRERVFLVCHGNAGNISHRLGLSAALLKTGAAVFLLDYRGYGRSAGRPSEAGTYRDVQAAHAWLRERGFAPTNIFALGESLGGAVATELAVREVVGGLVLHSTFTSVPDLGAELFPWLPVRWLGTIQYDTRGKLPRIRVPVLVLHSRTDSLVAFHHAERNFAAANEPKAFAELQGDHNDPLWEGAGFAEGMERFLRLAEKKPGG